jgi:histidine ammonia-lyase
MGATSANKILRILEQAQQVIAIELLCAAQMLEFRKPLKPGVGVQRAYDIVRFFVPMLDHDRVLSPDIATISRAVKEGAFDELE